MSTAAYCAIGDEQLEDDAEEGETDHEQMLAAARDELGRGRHRRQVGANVDDVRDEQDRDQDADDALGNALPRLLARPAPVTRPMCALTSWTADISG